MARPKLHRNRKLYLPRMEAETEARLREQAEAVGMSLATYMEHLVAEAHDYHGRYLQELTVLPAAVSAEDLRARTRTISPQDCPPVVGSWPRRGVRLDGPLSELVDVRSAQLGAAKVDYLRAIYRYATGLDRDPQHVQLSLDDAASISGEVGLARAG